MVMRILFFCRYLALKTVDEANGWYGGMFLGDQEESSEINWHYAELIQVEYRIFNLNYCNFFDDYLRLHIVDKSRAIFCLFICYYNPVTI